MDNLQTIPKVVIKDHISVSTKTVKIYPLHWHEYFEIEIITKGKGTNILNGNKYEISAGCGYLLKPTDYHEVKCDEEIELHSVIFRETMLNETMLLNILHSESRKSKCFTSKEFEALLLAIELLKNENERSGEYKRQLLEYIVHFFVEKQENKLNPQQISGINKALLYLEVHFREPLSLSMLAKEAGFNSSYFSEIFKQSTGETYTQKLNNLRLEYACTLLTNKYPVSYACFESGFGSLSNFFTAFKKKYGINPSEYVKLRG